MSKKKNKNSRNTARIFFIFIYLFTIPPLALSPFFISDVQLYSSKFRAVESQLETYKHGGWSIEETEKKFEGDYSRSVMLNYLIDRYRKDNLDKIVTHADLTVDRQKSYIAEVKGVQAQRSATFYIPDIRQDTNRLEYTLASIGEGISSDNFYLAQWALSRTESEIEYLSDHQDIDIEKVLDQKVHTVKSINSIGRHYGLSFAKEVEDAKKIKSKDTELIERFKELDELISTTSSKLDKKVRERGGRRPTGDKWIVIVISQQRLYMIEGYEIVYTMPASTGIHGHGTAAGEFKVYEKIPMAWGYYEIWMPYWLTVYYSGGLSNGIHGIPISPINGRWSHWDAAVGYRPMTYGCIMPHDPDAKKVYEWADIGTPVSILY